MDKEAVLKKAIEKAIKNGWNNRVTCSDNDCIESLIFNKDFAKAFWGDHDTEKVNAWNIRCKQCGMITTQDYEFSNEECWKKCLQRMVISPDPLKYLEQFI